MFIYSFSISYLECWCRRHQLNTSCSVSSVSYCSLEPKYHSSSDTLCLSENRQSDLEIILIPDSSVLKTYFLNRVSVVRRISLLLLLTRQNATNTKQTIFVFSLGFDLFKSVLNPLTDHHNKNNGGSNTQSLKLPTIHRNSSLSFPNMI